MQTPENRFKKALRHQQPQIGLWMGLGSTLTTDICAGAGFDWLVIDGEHGPNDLTTLLAQLQVVAAYPNSHPVVRVPHDNAALLKQVLDIGATTVLVPMVDTAAQAAAIVKACRYPQDDGQGGIRGMAGTRAARWGRYPNYGKEANAQVCVLVQAETREALKTWTRLLLHPAWTACSLARQTYRPPWATSATPATPKYKRPSWTRLRAFARQAKRPAF